MWAQPNRRHRWSVAFPIVESYDITGNPKAREVLGAALYQRLYARPSAVLRLLEDEERATIGPLELEPRPARNAYIGIEDEFDAAMRSEINKQTRRSIGQDISEAAIEGMTQDRWAKIRLRAMWIADKFIIKRRKSGSLFCDACGFDPASRPDLSGIKPRSLLDVHHRDPLAEGKRYTTIADFELLCPTCHRIAHAKLR